MTGTVATFTCHVPKSVHTGSPRPPIASNVGVAYCSVHFVRRSPALGHAPVLRGCGIYAHTGGVQYSRSPQNVSTASGSVTAPIPTPTCTAERFS
jgi:hypothetical protein